MKLFRSLLLGVSVSTFFVDALPVSGPYPVPGIASREDIELLPRNKLFVPHGSYNKQKAVEFVKGIPLEKLHGIGAGTLHSWDKHKKVADGNERQETGFRLDKQGHCSGYDNLQVQMNHKGARPKGVKTTVGCVLVKGNMRAKDIKKHLVHAVMHPNRDRHGNEYPYIPKSIRRPR